MKKRLLCISVIVSLIVVSSCEQKVEEDSTTKEKIGQLANKALADSAIVSFRLDSLTGYTWDKAFIITPYSQLDKLSHNSNVDLSPIEKTGIESNDSKNVIAFITKGKVISYIDLPRTKGDFSYLKRSGSNDSVLTYPFGDAKFRMVNKKGWPVVEGDEK